MKNITIGMALIIILLVVGGYGSGEQSPVLPGGEPAANHLAVSPDKDDAKAIQARLDAQAATGGCVKLDAATYRLRSPLRIPEGVTLAGVWEAPHHAQLGRGTVFEVYAGKGDENGPPLILLEPSSAVRGITFFYPQQRVPDAIAYPWTIQGRGMHGSVMDCTFVNAYKAIDFGTHHNELHYIRNCFGCPLKVGVHIDKCTDIGRIENVHFNPHYWGRCGAPNTPSMEVLIPYLMDNLVAFEFARTDWEYVINTFCFGAKIGYRFHKTGDGTVNGNFLGIGADWCRRAVLVEHSQPPGLLITNGEFVGGQGTDAMMEVTATHTGVVQLANCSFWGPAPTVAIVDGKGQVSLNQCNFRNYVPDRPEMYTLDLRGGDVSIQGCAFGMDRRDIRLGPDITTAIITGNWFNVAKDIDIATQGDVQQASNVVRPAAK